MDLGFRLAGFESVWAVDSNPLAQKTYLANLGLKPMAKKIEKVKHFPRDTGGVGLLACTPCQGFSLIGDRDPDDARNQLYKQVARCISELRPRFFVFENVRGMALLYGKRFLNLVLESYGRGYDLNWRLLDAADYGVPQHRKRLFIVGFRKDLEVDYEFPQPTHGPGLKPYATLRDAIGDLKSPPLEEYYHDDDWPFFYMSRNRRADWDSPSYTIQAESRHIALHPSSPPMRHAGKDRWVFTAARSKYRRLSVRECARLQTFPDWFRFTGGLDPVYRQIGNAVPPLLAQTVARSIVPHLTQKE